MFYSQSLYLPPESEHAEKNPTCMTADFTLAGNRPQDWIDFDKGGNGDST